MSRWEGQPIASWEARLGVPMMEAWATLPSTNDRALELAAAGSPAFTLVVAETQSAGRGRRGRRWDSPSDVGLWMSLVLRPAGGAASARLVPLLMGLAVSRAIERRAPGVDAGVKWPNDVLVGGLKVAGILCESSLGDAVVAGVGVNVRRREGLAGGLAFSATTVEDAAGVSVERGELAASLLQEARALFDVTTARLEGALAEELSGRDVLRGRRVTLESGVEGMAAGIAPDGALLVEGPEGVRRVVAGSVRIS